MPDTIVHIVQQGEYFAQLALRFGFDADSVWNNHDNKHLRDAKRDPNILNPGDVIYFPEVEKKWLPTKLGASSTFTATVPTASVAVKLMFANQPIANQAFTGQAGYLVLSGTSGADGLVSFKAPMNARAAVIEFAAIGRRYTIAVGHLDPASTPNGVIQRLTHLGYLSQAGGGASAAAMMMLAVMRLQASNKIEATGVLCDKSLDALVDEHW